MMSVMTIISALEGMMDSIREDIGRLGPSTFLVSKMMIATSEEMFLDKIKRRPITMADAEAMEKDCQLCEKVSPRAFTQATLKYGNQTLRRILVGSGTANLVDIVDIEVAQGRFHSFEDDRHKRRVAFIGETVRKKFFEGVDAIGKTLKVNGVKYDVIGVAKARGSMFGEDQDDFAFIPLSCFLTQFGTTTRRGISIAAKARSIDQVGDAMDEARMILRSRRNVPYNKPDDFDMLTADSFMDFFNEFTRIFRLALTGISSISVVVGGIVVMNIMMVAVTERTREIGIRKSLGAKQNHILLQFMFESLALTLFGGVIGTTLGFVIAKSLVGMIDVDISPSILAISLGLSISGGTGLIFGIYPAMKAARLDPVRALSYE